MKLPGHQSVPNTMKLRLRRKIIYHFSILLSRCNIMLGKYMIKRTFSSTSVIPIRKGHELEARKVHKRCNKTMSELIYNV